MEHIKKNICIEEESRERDKSESSYDDSKANVMDNVEHSNKYKKKGKHLDPKFKNKSKEPCLFLENWNTMQKIAEIKSNQRMREI